MKTKRNYLTEDDLGMDKEAVKRSFAHHVEYTQAKDEFTATNRDFFTSLAFAARDRMCDRWNKTQQSYYRRDSRRVYYLSLEYLLGRLLTNSLLSLGIHDEARGALDELSIDFEDVVLQEADPGLGNGGLGRLAACFLDSMATLGLPAVGYGISYKYGIFRQEIVGGGQAEQPDTWLRYGTPWQIARPERAYAVHFGGRVDARTDADGRVDFAWVDTNHVTALANDMPVPGYRNDVVNTLRLWSAHATQELDFGIFNRGDYFRAVQEKEESENLTRVLYPNDQVAQGTELRLKQEYFFVSATIQDAIRRHVVSAKAPIETLPDLAVFQLNDTHPAIAIAEMMRILLDEHRLDWGTAWSMTTRSFAYTNHTVLPEALETWQVSLFERVLPRHLMIIYEINRRLMEEVAARWPEDVDRLRRMSLIDEGPPKRVRMAHLAIVGSYSVNGVSKLHSQILREKLFRDFAEMTPKKFGNQTNGITPRRWLKACNRPLTDLINATIGDAWVTDLDRLTGLVPYAEVPAFRAKFFEAKRRNKEQLALYIQDRLGIEVNPASLFDVHVKRLHEYKRQLLNILHVIALYQRIKAKPTDLPVPRTFIFGGKAAPGYLTAKAIIRLIHGVADVVNNDAEIAGRLKVVFIPNYSVSVAEIVIPAADLSEQISTAGMEASGTGNMKFALNGALTIGTLDGANIEILEAVGADNMFIFGMTEQEVSEKKRDGYDPRQVYQRDRMLADVLDAVARGDFSPDDPGRFRPLIDGLLYRDPFFVLEDFRDYRFCHQVVDAAYRDQDGWVRKAILNVAHMGRFSSDATIAGYARDIWRVPIQAHGR
jgi:glycogen phosphorylase